VTWIQSIVLALLQGVTELFPISSLGHTVIVTALLGWGQLETSPSFLPFLVLFHVGTATALFIYFRRDWVAIIRGLVVTGVAGRLDADPNGRVAWLLVAGTIPAGLVGVFLETPLKQLFASPLVAAEFLAVNGVILLVGERARRRSLAAPAVAITAGRSAGPAPTPPDPGDSQPREDLRPFATLSWRAAILVGLAQALALIPGISRSGVTMVAALRTGMSHEDAAAYTFLLATPIIGAAGVLELPQLAGNPSSTLLIAVVGGVLAGLAAYLSTRFLMRYFETHRLDPFGYYCLVAGLASLAYFALVR
jgi:undecaprenyl-diphosphatase